MIEPLPATESQFIAADVLLQKIRQAEPGDCRDTQGRPLLTLLDLRTEHFLDLDKPLHYIKSNCNTIHHLFDELTDAEVRNHIPTKGLLVTITETGNRDDFAIRYLSKFGYTNVVGLQFGMRGWIKLDYPQSIHPSTHTGLN